MKYVRTKDGKIVELKPHRFYKYVLKGEKLYLSGKEKHLYINNVVSQADTIEELIERYVVIFEYQDRPLIVFKSEIEHYKHCFANKVKSNNCVLAIYGSFWVGVDLLSKAKMNDKGEWELL